MGVGVIRRSPFKFDCHRPSAGEKRKRKAPRRPGQPRHRRRLVHRRAGGQRGGRVHRRSDQPHLLGITHWPESEILIDSHHLCVIVHELRHVALGAGSADHHGWRDDGFWAWEEMTCGYVPGY